MKKLGIKSYFKYNIYNAFLVSGKQKIFCIGRNKTGTTSLATEFRDLGYIVGHQRTAEKLIDHYIEKNFTPLIQYCKTAQVFQDVPFSWPHTYQYLDKAYPGSLFILSIRDSSEEWYRSISRFHAKLFGNGQIPSANQLKNAEYVHKGFMWKVNRALYDTSENDPYNKNILIKHYEEYNTAVINYFKERDNLLVINIKEPDSYSRFCQFIGVKQKKDAFPWVNKTSNI